MQMIGMAEQGRLGLVVAICLVGLFGNWLQMGVDTPVALPQRCVWRANSADAALCTNWHNGEGRDGDDRVQLRTA